MGFIRSLCIFAFLLFCLTGCFDVATTGAQAIYNRHAIQKNITDQIITVSIYRGFDRHNPAFKHVNISVATLHQEVLLTGQVPYAWQKQLAGRIANGVPDVKHVYNFIRIANPSSSLTRVSDTWITSKVKSQMMMSDEFDATQIKVTTENGTVYLMGMLFADEAKAAIEIARHTYGVQSVVTMFSIIAIQNKPNYRAPTLPNA